MLHELLEEIAGARLDVAGIGERIDAIEARIETQELERLYDRPSAAQE
jgi:hypothetical protein